MEERRERKGGGGGQLEIYRIVGIFRGVYISRISRKGPSSLTLKPRNLMIESGLAAMRLMPLCFEEGLATF